MGNRNITLIGMPGAGKSTIGKLLAAKLKYTYLDGDDLIEEREQRKLQDIIDTDGEERFKQIENDILAALQVKQHVLAPGGSVVYSANAMEHLQSLSIIVYLELPFTDLEPRLTNAASRGIVGYRGGSLKELFDERNRLYEKYSKITVKCANKTKTEIINEILDKVHLEDY